MKEYTIEVIITPHPWDNKEEPYFWWIKCYDSDFAKKDPKYTGHNSGACGWGKTPEDAWCQAIEYNSKYNISDN